MVFGIISENTKINNVNKPDAIATELSPGNIFNACAPTPAAPIVFANVFNVRIAASGRLIFSLYSSNLNPAFSFSFIRIDAYELGVERSIASSKEQINDKNSAKKK